MIVGEEVNVKQKCTQLIHVNRQSINQSITKSINQSSNQSINQSINQSVKQSINQPAIQPARQAAMVGPIQFTSDVRALQCKQHTSALARVYIFTISNNWTSISGDVLKFKVGITDYSIYLPFHKYIICSGFQNHLILSPPFTTRGS